MDNLQSDILGAQLFYIFGILEPRATFLRKKVFGFGPPKLKKTPFNTKKPRNVPQIAKVLKTDHPK